MGKALTLAVAGLVAAILNRIAGDEIKAWLPWFTNRLLWIAVEHLPEDQRERFSEEWASHVGDVPGDVGKLVTAVGCVWAAQQIRCTQTYGMPILQRVSKRFVDFSVAAAVLFLLAPMFLLSAALIKLERGIAANVLDRLLIPGADGKSFVQYRFNIGTIRKQVPMPNGPAYRTIEVSRLGSFFAWSGWNELPLLINVLRGDMALVGPVVFRGDVLIVLQVARSTATKNSTARFPNGSVWRISLGHIFRAIKFGISDRDHWK